ncbi:MAG TPA: hypothetical protein VF584_15910 [Longimicrobium sp.]|jgi:hypothetical protein
MKLLVQLLAALAVLYLAGGWLVANLASGTGGWLDVGYYVLVAVIGVLTLLALVRKLI